METFSEWLNNEDLGRYLLQLESAFFSHMVDDVFGFHAIQLGLPKYDFLADCRISRRISLGESPAMVRADPSQLPFPRHSIDLVLLPHTIDFSSEPHKVLSEVNRALVPGGRLVLTGFNPYSLWGLRRRFQRKHQLPWTGQFLSLSRIKDWLKLFDFELEEGKFMAYAPPFSGKEWLQSFRFMEKAGDRWWPMCAGVYGFKAVKVISGVHLLAPKWKRDKLRSKGLVPSGGSKTEYKNKQN